MRWLLWIVIAVLLVSAAGYLTLIFMLPWSIVTAPNRGKSMDERRTAPQALQALGVTREFTYRVGEPKAKICGWLLKSPVPRSRGAVVVFHGIRDHKRSMLSTGKLLARNGYDAVLLDHRGQGHSEGQWLTFGIRESQDAQQILELLLRRGDIQPPLGAIGFSYGAATAIQLAGRDARVRAVVAVASFESMKRVVHDYVKRFLPLPVVSDARIDRSIVTAGQMAGFNPSKAAPVDAIRKAQAHVLLAHGTADRRIPIAHAEAIHRAAPRRSQVLRLRSADHLGALRDRTGQVKRAMLRWLNRFMGPRDLNTFRSHGSRGHFTD